MGKMAPIGLRMAGGVKNFSLIGISDHYYFDMVKQSISVEKIIHKVDRLLGFPSVTNSMNDRGRLPSFYFVPYYMHIAVNVLPIQIMLRLKQLLYFKVINCMIPCFGIAKHFYFGYFNNIIDNNNLFKEKKENLKSVLNLEFTAKQKKEYIFKHIKKLIYKYDNPLKDFEKYLHVYKRLITLPVISKKKKVSFSKS